MGGYWGGARTMFSVHSIIPVFWPSLSLTFWHKTGARCPWCPSPPPSIIGFVSHLKSRSSLSAPWSDDIRPIFHQIPAILLLLFHPERIKPQPFHSCTKCLYVWWQGRRREGGQNLWHFDKGENVTRMNLQQTFTSRNGRCQNRNIILQTHQHLIVLPSPSSPSRCDLFSCVSDISNKLMIYNFPSRVSFCLTGGEWGTLCLIL